LRQIFVDTETTGLSPESGDRIIEIGCVEMVNRRLSGRDLHFFVNPERPNSEDAFKVHGLSDEFLADKPLFAAIADELLEYLAGAEIIIHNASFDIAFLNQELRRIGRGDVTGVVAKVTDSLLMARDTYPGKANSLDALCKRLEVNNANRTLHGALLDAGLLAEVYIRMTRGQDSLVIESVDAGGGLATVEVIDFSGFDLVVIEADESECTAHAALLAEIDKASAGRTVWHRLGA
jgi:DNA polymerase-3 subunit epsilon